jgi:serine/threonine protein kinase/WD40 repeat protein
MTGALACADVEVLRQLQFGRLPAAEADSLEEHLLGCAPCLERLKALQADDPLAGALRGPTNSSAPPRAEKAAADALIQRLKGLVPAGVSPHSDTAFPSDSVPAERPESADEEVYALLAPSQDPGEIGRLGNYRVLRVLGTGGMGVVFQAEDLALKRHAALKAMKPSMAASPSARQRFLREAQATAAIKHDHIVTIYQVGQQRGVPFLAMELLEGESLEERLRRTGRLPVAEVLHIGRETAEGLAAAHKRGLMHRDIKPANLWLESLPGESGGSASRYRVKILDFGLARAVSDEAHLTQQGVIVGTPAYMAPEQATGQVVGARCDLFSLGCVLYRLCTGAAAFKGKDAIAVLLAVASEHPKPPRQLNPEVPPALNNLILRLLAKDPADRPSSAAAVVKALTAIEPAPAGEPTQPFVPVTRPALVPVAVAVTPPVAVPVREASDPGSATEVLRPAPAAAPAADLRSRRHWHWLGRRRSLWAMAALLLVVCGGLLATPVLLLLSGVRGEGTVAIDAADPDVEVVVKQGGREVAVLNQKSRQEVALPFGTYEVELRGGKGGLKLETPQLALQRGAREVVRVVPKVPPVYPPGSVGELRRFHGHTGPVLKVAFASDGRRFYSSSEGEWVLWNVERVKELHRSPVPGWLCFTNSFAISGDGRTALIGADNKSDGTSKVLLWDWEDGKELYRFEGHASTVRDVSFSPDGRKILAAEAGGVTRVWDIRTCKELQRLEGSVARFLPDGRRAITGKQQFLIIWDLDSGKERQRFEVAIGGYGITGLDLSPDGRRALVGSRESDRPVRLWDIEDGKELQCYKGHPWSRSSVALAFSPDGRRVLSGGGDSTVRLWDVASGKELHCFKGHHGAVQSVAFSPDGRWALSGGDDHVVILWGLPK